MADEARSPQPSGVGRFTETKAGAQPSLDQLTLDRVAYLWSQIKSAIPALSELGEISKATKEQVEQQLAEYALSIKTSKLDPEQLESFFKKPYYLLPVRGRDDSWNLIIPKFIDLQIGYLERSTDSYNLFLINRYMDWLGEVPDIIKKQLNWKVPPDLVLEGEELAGTPKALDYAEEHYKGLLGERGEKGIHVNPKRAFELLAALVKDGVLPFGIKPIATEDIMDGKFDFELRPYQKEAWGIFCKYSNIGIFWPPGMGKTIIGLKAVTGIKPPHLIAVPSKLLVEQWEDRIQAHTDLKLGQDVFVTTYQGAVKLGANKRFKVKITDEVHHLPANYFIKLSMIKSDYSIGLSACIAANTPVMKDDWSWTAIGALSDKTVSLASTGSGLTETRASAVVMQTDWCGRSAVRLTTHSGKSLTATQDHPLLGYRNGVPRWMKASDFVLGDFIGMSDVEALTPEEQRLVLVGYAYGEGHYKKARSHHPSDGERFILTVHEDEEPFVTKLLTTLGLRYSSRKRPNNKACSVEILDRGFKAYLLSLGYPRGRKTLQTLSCPFKEPSQRLLFAKGLWMAEGYFGHIRKRQWGSAQWVDAPCLALCTKVEGGLDDIFQTLTESLISLGIKSRLHYKINAWGSMQVSLFVAADLDNLLRFYHHFSPWLSYKADRANKILAWVIAKTQMLAVRREKMLRVIGGHSEASIPTTTTAAWRRIGRRHIAHSVGLRGVMVSGPPTSKSMRWEMISGLDRLEAHGAIFDAHVPATSNFIAAGFLSHNTPYREDGREEFIFALTGKPVGLPWDYFKKANLLKNPVAHVWILKNFESKIRRIEELLKEDMRTVIFSDSIDTGTLVSKRFGIPFAYGQTKDNMKTILEHRVVVVSRVGDEGMSLPDLERIIEVSWLGGSRRQELQRFLRGAHSQVAEPSDHILMTLDEYVRDRKRLYSIMDKGFKIVLHREGVAEKVIEQAVKQTAVPRPRREPASRESMNQGQMNQIPVVTPEIPAAVMQRLPGITRTLERLTRTEKAVAVTMLGNPTNSYSTKELSLATGYSISSLENLAHYGKLIGLGLIKKEGEKYRSAI